MTGLEYRSLPFRLQASPEGGGEFEGLGSVFCCIDESWTRDIVAPGAFAADLPEFLRSGFIGGVNHDWDMPIGRPLQAEETAEGLFVRGTISDTQAGRDVRTLMKDGVITRLSIGFRTLAREYLETAEEVARWWQGAGYMPTPEDVARSRHGARLLTRIRLYEVSPVAVPANPHAVITAVKGERGGPRVPLPEQVRAELEECVARVRAGGGLAPDDRSGFRALLAAGERRAGEGARLFAQFQAIEAGFRRG